MQTGKIRRAIKIVAGVFTTVGGWLLFAIEKGWHALDVIGRGEVATKLVHIAESVHEFMIAHESLGWQMLPWVMMLGGTVFLVLLQWPQLWPFPRARKVADAPPIDGDKLAKESVSEDIEKYVDDSMPYLSEKLGDLNALTEHGCLTVAQCALLVPAILTLEKPVNATEIADHFIRLALLDVAHGELFVKHPKTLLPYSEYLRMADAGMFGPDGKDMPLADASWLVPLEEAEQWFQHKGFPTDLGGLKADLMEMATPASVQTSHSLAPPRSPALAVIGKGNTVSSGQSGGTTAGFVFNATAPANFSAPQREINDLQRNRFSQAASLAPGVEYSVPIRLNDGSSEGRAYLNKILALFAITPGWTAFSQGEMANTLTAFSGLHIEVGNAASVPMPVEILRRAFNDAGIQFEIVEGPRSWAASDFRIVIGTYSQI